MNEAVEYRLNAASKWQIVEHLRTCDVDFVPRLGYRVNIEEYAAKIERKAIRFEAWSGSKLVGLVAAYLNNGESKSGFITSVSVLRKWMGKGIASQLLKRCICSTEELGMRHLRLEVAVDNRPAINLYKKNGFNVTKVGTAFITMTLNFNGAKDERQT